MTQTIEQVDVFSFSDNELIGRGEKEVKTFALQLIAEGRIIYPVLATTLNNTPVVLDGVKRVLACRYIVENDLDDDDIWKTVPTIMMENPGPKERATLTIATNEQRSDNEIAAYLSMKELKDRGKWDEVAKLYKFNPSRFKSLSQLDNIKEQDFFFEAFERGDVARSTMFAISKLDQPRQKMVFAKAKDLFEQEKRLTAKDIREIKSTASNKVLASLDLQVASSPRMEKEDLFVYYNDGKFSQAYGSLNKAMAADEKGVLYRLLEVGRK